MVNATPSRCARHSFVTRQDAHGTFLVSGGHMDLPVQSAEGEYCFLTP